MILATDASAHETQNDPKEWCELDDEVVRANVVRVHCLLKEIIPASVHVPNSHPCGPARYSPLLAVWLGRTWGLNIQQAVVRIAKSVTDVEPQNANQFEYSYFYFSS